LKALVTGGAGFIGSHVVEDLLRKGFEVVVIDNLSSGKYEYIEKYVLSGDIKFVNIDLKSFSDELLNLFKNVDVVYHLAANPEVRTSLTEPRVHFNDNVLATFNVLEACRLNNVKSLVFTSSSTVYGDAKVIPTPENYSPLEPISVYGASKLASENLIITYSRLYGIKSIILRLANIVGSRQSHGVIVDFIKKLRSSPEKLEILGDGKQRKSYLHISDLIIAINTIMENVDGLKSSYEVFNVGNIDWIDVDEIASEVVSKLGLKDVKFHHVMTTSDGRGWVGDVKFMLLDVSKLCSLGWKPRLNSREAIRVAIEEIIKYL